MFTAILAAAAASAATPAELATCAAEVGIAFVCGIPAPEDLIRIPETPWLIATSMPRDGSAGGLFLVDSRTREARPVDLSPSERATFASTPDEASAAAKCPRLKPETFISHGISLRRGRGGVHGLYVVGHGAREAIELFNVDARNAVPTIAWAGCVEMPAGVEANSVVHLPGGGMIFTTLYDPGESDWSIRIAKLASAAASGGVFEWHADRGFRRLAIPPMSGPNGIAVSADGRAIFLAGWGDRIVRRLDRQGKETAQPVMLSFLPDNLHWTPDGSLLAAGQPVAVQELFACTPPRYCSPTWAVARLNAETLRIEDNWLQQTGGSFGDSTSAIMVGNRLWVGSINGDRIAVIELQGAASKQRRRRPHGRVKAN
jgi:hypothetical protein